MISNEEKLKREIKVLIDSKFFDLESGQIIIDKHNGVIQKIKWNETLYVRSNKLDKNK